MTRVLEQSWIRERERGRDSKGENVEGKMYPCRRWNKIRMPRRGCAKGERGEATDVYHKSHCPPLTEFVEPLSLPLRRIQHTQRAMRATRCKTLPVNFITLGTSSYTSTCTARHLTRPGTARTTPTFAYTLGRESDRGNIQTYTHARTHGHLPVHI